MIVPDATGLEALTAVVIAAHSGVRLVRLATLRAVKRVMMVPAALARMAPVVARAASVGAGRAVAVVPVRGLIVVVANVPWSMCPT